MKSKRNSLDALFGETLPARTAAKPAGTWFDALIKPKKDNRPIIECDPGLETFAEALGAGRCKVVTRKR